MQQILADKWGFRGELEMGEPLLFGKGSAGNTQLLSDFWDAVRDVLLPAWIQEHPGTRPFAWWRFTHKQERPIIKEWKGFIRENWLMHSFLHTHVHNGRGKRPMQESERDYLERHDLLDAAERSAMTTNS